MINRKSFLRKLGLGGILSFLPISLLGYNNTNKSDEYIIKNNKEIVIVTKHYSFTLKHQNNGKYLIVTDNIKVDDKLYTLVSEFDYSYSIFCNCEARYYLKEDGNITELKKPDIDCNIKTKTMTFRLEIAD